MISEKERVSTLYFIGVMVGILMSCICIAFAGFDKLMTINVLLFAGILSVILFILDLKGGDKDGRKRRKH